MNQSQSSFFLSYFWFIIQISGRPRSIVVGGPCLWLWWEVSGLTYKVFSQLLPQSKCSVNAKSSCQELRDLSEQCIGAWMEFLVLYDHVAFSLAVCLRGPILFQENMWRRSLCLLDYCWIYFSHCLMIFSCWWMVFCWIYFSHCLMIFGCWWMVFCRWCY